MWYRRNNKETYSISLSQNKVVPIIYHLLTTCHRLNVGVLPKLTGGTYFPWDSNCTWSCWDVTGVVGVAPMNGTGALLRGPREPPASSALGEHSETWLSVNHEALTKQGSLGSLMPDLPDSRPVIKRLLLFISHSLWFCFSSPNRIRHQSLP